MKTMHSIMKTLAVGALLAALPLSVLADSMPFWLNDTAPNLTISPASAETTVFPEFQSWDSYLQSSMLLPLFTSEKLGLILFVR